MNTNNNSTLKGSDVKVNDRIFTRYPVKTEVILPEHNLEYFLSFAQDKIQENDIVFLSEKVVSIIDNEIIDMNDVKVSKLADVLSRNVSQTPGANLTNPAAMQIAIEQAGTFKILMAAAASVFGKIFKKKGLFYIVAGDDIRGIDAPDKEAIPPFDQYISMSPKDSTQTAIEASAILNCRVAILDANYRGVNILGVSHDDMQKDIDLYREIFRDNPLGQKREQTPIGIVREK